MSNKKLTWLKIADTESKLSFTENNLLIIEVNEKKITLAKYNDELFACAYFCPHASGVLAYGYIDLTGNIVCPVHCYRFNLLNGRNVSGEGYYLKIYPVKSSDEGVLVGFEEKGFPDFL